MLAIASAVALVALIVHELRTREPIVDLRLFKDRSYSVGVFLMTVLGFALYGSLVLLPIMLQTLFGYPSLEAGEAMAPRGLGSLIMMPLVGVLTGIRRCADACWRSDWRVGGVTMLWLGQLNLKAGFWDIFWPQLLQGAGLSLLFVPLTTVSMATIAPRANGIRDQPVQPDAQHRRRHRHRDHRHDAGAPAAGLRRRCSASGSRSSTRRRRPC